MTSLGTITPLPNARYRVDNSRRIYIRWQIEPKRAHVMTGRERVLAALGRQRADCVPYVELDVDRSVARGLTGLADPTPLDVARALGTDCVLPHCAYAEIPARWAEDHDGTPAYLGGLIANRDDLRQVHLPPVREKLDGVRRYVDAYGGSGLATITRCNLVFDMVAFSMGYDTLSLALFDDPGLVAELCRCYTEWTVAFIEGLPDTGVDVLWTTDDLAFKSGPFLSPSMLRTHFLPFMQQAARAVSLPWIFHSDGDISLLLEDILALGIDGLHPLEPGAMSIDAVMAEYGDRVCLVGNVDLHYTLTRGTPEETRAEVAGLLARLGAHNGYMIASANSLTHYCRIDNIRAMAETIAQSRRG